MIQHVEPILTSNYPTPAKRPLNSRLNNEKIQLNFELQLPDWKQGVAYTVTELLNKE